MRPQVVGQRDRVGSRDASHRVTDLRLGMTGFHPFRFVFAEHLDGRWQPLAQVERLPFSRGQPEHLLTLWQRIWDEREPLQLVSWAKALQEKP